DEEIVDDNLREKLLNVCLLIANIEALKDNPILSSEFLTKSSSTSPKSFLEETNIFHNSLPKFESFYFDLEEISSGSTTTHSDIILPDYEVFYFYDDHIEEISSGSTTTHSDVSLSEYDSFIFDLLNDQFSTTDRCDFTHEEFADELAHIISPPEYDCFHPCIPACCDDDDDYNSAITLVLSTEEPDNSLSMGDEHLDTIPATKSDEVIKSSIEDQVSIPSEFEGIPDTMCDVHLVNNPS
nr:hypothetical protein [Tanacetum cinerariifolium]